MRTKLKADALRAAMLERGLDGQGLAARAGISGATVSHALNGKPVNHKTLHAIAKALTEMPVVQGVADLLD